MPSLTELQARLDTLRQLRAMGVTECQVGADRRVVFRTDAQMATAIAALEREIAAFTTPPVTTVLVSATKGLDT